MDLPEGGFIAKIDPSVAFTMKTEGVKFDGGKPRYDLLPPELLDGVATILGYGAAKYADRNWELGMDWGRVFGAAQRHQWAWARGEELDTGPGGSNLPHLWHAGCNLAFLMAYTERKIGKDSRSKSLVVPQSS